MRSIVLTPEDSAASEVVARYRQEPAPLLPILHALQEQDGYLREEALAVVANELRIEPGDLYGVITFYHFFRLAPPPAAEICNGPACRLALGPGGDAALRAALGEDTSPMACPGRCDRPVAVRLGGKFLEGAARGGVDPNAFASLRTIGPVLLRNCGHPDQTSLPGAVARGAYSLLKNNLPSDVILAELEASGLAGRGGAGFPAAAKWRAVLAAAGSPKYVVVNADEGEPGTFKDRVILEHDPHLLLEGVAIAARAVGSTTAIIYLRYEYPEAKRILEQAVDEAGHSGMFGDLKFWVRRGAGAYICGEETSLLNSLEGKKPFPRDKPPYPVTHGLYQKPTLLSNVETFAAVPRILEMGAAAWKTLGRRGQPGTKLYSISGDVAHPGNFEAPFGSTVRELLFDFAEGPRNGRTIRAFTMGGLSGGLLPASELDLPLDFQSPKARGAMLGSGGIVAIDDSRCLVDFVRNAMAFFRDESCGKCFPCRIGTQRIVERLDQLAESGLGETPRRELDEIATVMTRASACGLGLAAPAILQGLLKHFPEEIDAHQSGHCPKGICRPGRTVPIWEAHHRPPRAAENGA